MCITKNGVVRGKSWTRQTLSEAWESTNWEGLCGAPWQMVALELKLAKKVTADKGGVGPHCRGLWLKEHQRLNPEGSTFCLRTLKLTDTLQTAQAVQRLHRMEKRPSHIMTNAEIESENLDGKSKDECLQGQNRRDRASEREEKSSSSERCRGCAQGT